MCLINDGLTLYFQTDKSFEKIKNISENPNVAINLGVFLFQRDCENYWTSIRLSKIQRKT